MKIVIIGGTGLIGSKLAPLLSSRGHEVLHASPSRGVNAVTGEGLQPALAGADIEPTGRANARPMTCSAKQSIFQCTR
jgi:uncharacterized protein YbjT (DUF2867 family)